MTSWIVEVELGCDQISAAAKNGTNASRHAGTERLLPSSVKASNSHQQQHHHPVHPPIDLSVFSSPFFFSSLLLRTVLHSLHGATASYSFYNTVLNPSKQKKKNRN